MGPRWLATVSSNTLRVSKLIGQWVSLLVRCRRVNLQTVCPFNLRILVVKAEPTSVAGPKYHPKINLLSGKVGRLSRNITQSYQPNSHMWLMLAVLPVIMVSGTSPLVIYTELLVNERINASSSIQWSQSTLGEPVLIILRDTPCFSLRIQPSAACCHGE